MREAKDMRTNDTKKNIDINEDTVFGVIGVCGINGNLISRILMDHGYKVIANDMVNPEDCRFKSALKDYPDMEIYYGGVPESFFEKSDYIVLPMALIESKSMLYQKVKKYNIPILTPEDICDMFIPAHPVICITGTNGKTTTVAMLKNIAYKSGLKPCEHNLDNLQGNAADIPALQSRLKGDLNILETGTFGVTGSLKKLAEPCHPDVGIITNITPDHLDKNERFLDYAMVKGELIELLRGKKLIVNNDDPTIKALLDKLDYEGEVITYGLETNPVSKSTKQCFCGNDAVVDEYIAGVGVYSCKCGIKYQKPDFLAFNINDEHNEFDLKTPDNKIMHFELSVNGLHNIYNATAAIVCALKILQLDYDTIYQAIKEFNGVDGRMQTIGKISDKTIMVDYAHNPAGISTVLAELKNMYNVVVDVITTSSESGIKGDHEILENALKYADYIIPASNNTYDCAKEALDNKIGINQIILPEYLPQGEKVGTLGASKDQVKAGLFTALSLANKNIDLIVLTGEAAYKFEETLKDEIHSFK